MSSNPTGPGLSPDDALPPVEPPSAGFIVQLFLVPGVIVVVVVLIWVLFNWLAQKGNDRDAFVRALSRNNEARWQAAFNLANALRAERGATHAPLSNDPELAAQLAGILDREIEAGSLDENPLMLRVYLCLALGEFKVPDGLPVLMRAATTVRGEPEQQVRRAALEGIARLAANMEPADAGAAHPLADNEPLSGLLLEASKDDDPNVRSVATISLGVIGAPPLVARLHFMLEDANFDVRANAATRLAQRGDARAQAVLVDMLDPDETAGVELEANPEMRPFKRALITVNALRAAQQLAEKNADADLAPLAAAAQKLLAGDASGELRLEATNLSQQLERRAQTVPP